jgi:hypothetical protein
MNDAEILFTGELCQSLLTSEGFKTVIQQHELSIAHDILTTKADDKSRREELYFTLWGARELLNFMQLKADAAAHIKAETPPTEEGSTDYATPALVLYDDEGFEIGQRADEENDY